MIYLRFLAPAFLLGACLLLGERSAGPSDDIPAAELSAAADEQDSRPAPCPGLVAECAVASLPPVRLPPAAAAGLTAGSPLPEQRSHSPPPAA